MLNPIGFVGIGIMGKGMLKNLITKIECPGFVIWNRNTAVCEEIKTQYPEKIIIASTPAEVIQKCEVTYSILSTLEASQSVFEGTNGIYSGISPGKIVVDCATLSPERMIEEASVIESKGGMFIEAPVSGSKVPAEMAQLIFLCGGDPTTYEKISPGLDAMGKAKYLFGPVGQGSRVKLVVNMIMGTMMGAFAEGMALGKASDIPLDLLLQVLDQGAMSNPMFRLKGPNILKDAYDPHFPLKHAQKDMRLALELAEQKGLQLTTSTAANEVYVKAINVNNSGDEDLSAVYKAV
eukprot:gene14445-19384_t